MIYSAYVKKERGDGYIQYKQMGILRKNSDGKYPSEISDETAYIIGKSYGSYLQEKYQKNTCIVSWDNNSFPMPLNILNIQDICHLCFLLLILLFHLKSYFLKYML